MLSSLHGPRIGQRRLACPVRDGPYARACVLAAQSRLVCKSANSVGARADGLPGARGRRVLRSPEALATVRPEISKPSGLGCVTMPATLAVDLHPGSAPPSANNALGQVRRSDLPTLRLRQSTTVIGFRNRWVVTGAYAHVCHEAWRARVTGRRVVYCGRQRHLTYMFMSMFVRRRCDGRCHLPPYADDDPLPRRRAVLSGAGDATHLYDAPPWGSVGKCRHAAS
ncbi:hypothetical protein DENSPDRAFT_129666 [Dentipellis sp. KUC8613]|nr:hypothetical protein DENSPDRAFT_129666 [Dentipellis sp. KUC8613]